MLFALKRNIFPPFFIFISRPRYFAYFLTSWEFNEKEFSTAERSVRDEETLSSVSTLRVRLETSGKIFLTMWIVLEFSMVFVRTTSFAVMKITALET